MANTGCCFWYCLVVVLIQYIYLQDDVSFDSCNTLRLSNLVLVCMLEIHTSLKWLGIWILDQPVVDWRCGEAVLPVLRTGR